MESDFKLVGNSEDKFQQLLVSLVADRMGAQFASLTEIAFETVSEKRICIVKVDRSQEPVYLSGSRGKEFYVRLGNTSRALDPQETVSYTDSNWG
jgi:hypothetical protein